MGEIKITLNQELLITIVASVVSTVIPYEISICLHSTRSNDVHAIIKI